MTEDTDELIIPSLQSTHAFTLKRETGKVCFFFQKENGLIFEIYNHYWPWNAEGEEVKFKLRERERKEQNAPRSDPKPKQKIKLTKLRRTHKVRSQRLYRTGYDPKSVDKFGGIVG